MMKIDQRQQHAMKKTLFVLAGVIYLTIEAPPEIALLEIKEIGATILTANRNTVGGYLLGDFSKAEELIANGWEWK